MPVDSIGKLEKAKMDPYIEGDEYFPDIYTLEMLAYTNNWRLDENKKMLIDSINRINLIVSFSKNLISA